MVGIVDEIMIVKLIYSEVINYDFVIIFINIGV